MTSQKDYFKIHMIDAQEMTDQASIIVDVPPHTELQVHTRKNGVVSWDTAEIRGRVEMKSRPPQEIKSVAQKAYEDNLGDKWITFAALYLPIVQAGDVPRGFTEPLWGFWRERKA